MSPIRQLTREEALAIANSEAWRKWDDDKIVRLQLYQDRLCMDFGRFHEAVEKVLGRPVWTHEFAGETGQRRLQEEYEGKRTAPTMEEIIGYLPAEKTIVLDLGEPRAR